MTVAKPLRDDCLYVSAQQPSARVAKHPFGFGVDLHNSSCLIDSDDGIRSRFDQPTKIPLSTGQVSRASLDVFFEARTLTLVGERRFPSGLMQLAYRVERAAT